MEVGDDRVEQGAGATAEGPGAAAADGVNRKPKRLRGGSRWMRRLADVLLIAGGLVLAYPFWSAGYAQIQQGRLDQAFRQSSASFAPIVSANTGSRSRNVPTREIVRRLAVLYGARLKEGGPVGRLRIPHISLDRIVQQGVGGRAGLDPSGDAALLRGGPVHYGLTPLPGAGDPVAIAGHRTTFGAPFYRLDKLRPGDLITLETQYARFRYRVAKTTEVLPTDIGVLSDRGYALVLTTCTPPGFASYRLIVWASLRSATPLKKAVSASP